MNKNTIKNRNIGMTAYNGGTDGYLTERYAQSYK